VTETLDSLEKKLDKLLETEVSDLESKVLKGAWRKKKHDDLSSNLKDNHGWFSVEDVMSAPEDTKKGIDSLIKKGLLTILTDEENSDDHEFKPTERGLEVMYDLFDKSGKSNRAGAGKKFPVRKDPKAPVTKDDIARVGEFLQEFYPEIDWDFEEGLGLGRRGPKFAFIFVNGISHNKDEIQTTAKRIVLDFKGQGFLNTTEDISFENGFAVIELEVW